MSNYLAALVGAASLLSYSPSNEVSICCADLFNSGGKETAVFQMKKIDGKDFTKMRVYNKENKYLGEFGVEGRLLRADVDDQRVLVETTKNCCEISYNHSIGAPEMKCD